MTSKAAPPWLVKVYAVLFGMIILCSAAVVYLLVLRHVFGNFQVGSEAYFDDAKARVAVLQSGYTQSHLSSRDAPLLKGQWETWRNYLGMAGYSCDLIEDEDLESWTLGDVQDYDVLVLPGTICLSDRQRERIEWYLSEGGGVVATWYAGCRDGSGNWVGFDFLERLTDAKVTEIAGDPDGVVPKFLSLRGETPVTAGIPPGMRLALADGSLALAVVDGGGVDGVYTTWTRDPQDLIPGRELGPFLSIVHSRPYTGRFVWFGFTISNLRTEEPTETLLADLAGNAVTWAAGKPIAGIGTWPDGQSCAVVFSQDTESHYENAGLVAKLFKEHSLPVTFFCVSDMAEDHNILTSALAGAGEVGSHSNNHTVYTGESYEVQLKRIRQSKETLEEITGTPCVGLRPPEERYDNNTLKALSIAGFDYLVGGVNLPADVPRIHTIGRKETGRWERQLWAELVEIPRNGADDFLIMVQREITEPDQIVEEYKRSFLSHYLLGGIYMLSFHTHLLANEKLEAVLPRLTNLVRSRNVWIATSAKVASWWQERNGIRISQEVAGPYRLRVHLSSVYEKTIPRAEIFLHLPSRPGGIAISSDILGTPIPEYYLDDGDCRLRLKVQDLRPFENRAFLIDFS